MTINAAFTVNGLSTTHAISVVAGAAVTAQIVDPTGIAGFVWSFKGTDRVAHSAPTLSTSGSPQGSIATFTMPIDFGDGLGQAYLLECRASDGRSPSTTVAYRAVIGVNSALGVLPLSANEELERSSTHGWVETLNNTLNAGGLLAGLGPFVNDTDRTATVITTADFGKFAFQYDTGALWVVGPVAGTSGATAEWKTVSGSGSSFNGDFATLLTGLTVYSYWQPDLRLVEDTTLRQTSGSTAVLTFTGTRTGAPTSIIVTCPTTGGARGTWLGVVTYIDGSTQSFTSAATVALTGRGAGLTLNIAAGTVATGNTWQACAATLTDSITSNSLASDGPTVSPLILTGINGMASVSTNATTWVHNNTVDLPAPTFTLIAVVRRLSVPVSNGVLFGGDTGFFGSIRSLSSGGVDMYNGSVANQDAGPTANTWGLLIASFTNSTSDSLKFGSAVATSGASAGGTNPAAGRALGALINGSSGCAAEFLVGAWVAGGIPANIAAIKSGITSRYGAGIPV